MDNTRGTTNTPELELAPLYYAGFCPIPPVAKGRPRFSTRTMSTYTPKETRAYEDAVRRWFMRDYGGKIEPMNGSLKARYEFVIPKPSSAKRLFLSHTKPDIDNFVKAFQDAMDYKVKSDGVALGVIANDSRISSVASVKRYARDGEQCGTWFSLEKALSRVVIDCRDHGHDDSVPPHASSIDPALSMSAISAVRPIRTNDSSDAIRQLSSNSVSPFNTDIVSALDPTIPRLLLSDLMIESGRRGTSPDLADTTVAYAIGVGASGEKRDTVVNVIESVMPNLDRIVIL